jgi:hypothetical protein
MTGIARAAAAALPLPLRIARRVGVNHWPRDDFFWTSAPAFDLESDIG